MNIPIMLINTNIVRPPVSPIGLEYVGEALVEAGLPVRILDLAMADDWQAAINRELDREEPLAVGLTVRNTDDCSFATGKSFIPWIIELVSKVKSLTDSTVVLGGVGFSVMPEAIIRLTGADIGIAGDGEEVMPALARCLMKGDDFTHLPNLIYRQGRNMIRNETATVDLNKLPIPRRSLFDNRRYEELGAIVGIETKRGCPKQCVYCADPVVKGNITRLRPPETVVREFKDLIARGVSWFHLCDSEFNQPLGHAKEICQEIIAAELSDRIHWYCYCSPVPFDNELANLMKEAGCYGINFGIDSICDEQLSRLGRDYSASNIRKLVFTMKNVGIDYMFDLLIGGPGETPATVEENIGAIKDLDVPLAGMAVGLRVYGGTSLARSIVNGALKEGLHPEATDEFHRPVFYVSPHLGDDPFRLVHELVEGDPRFLLLSSPDDEANYNYTDDQGLSRIIENGARGAYWHILSQNR